MRKLVKKSEDKFNTVEAFCGCTCGCTCSCVKWSTRSSTKNTARNLRGVTSQAFR